MPLEIPEEIREKVNGALDDGFPMSLSAVSPEGAPLVSFRGSLQTYGDDALALWVRSAPSSTLEAIARNPRVAAVYTNMAARKFWIFEGRAQRTDDAEARDRIWEGQHALEQARDPERNGVAVIVELDRISGGGVDIRR